MIFGLTYPAASMEVNNQDGEEKITVLQLNIGNYGDYRSLREPEIIPDVTEIKKLLWDPIDNERNQSIKIFFKKVKELKPDIITLQEAYGAVLDAEKAGIRPLLKKYLDNEYWRIEAALNKKIKNTGGSAIIFYRKGKFNFLKFQSDSQSAYVILQNEKTRQNIMVASAHIAGFDLAGNESTSTAGNGRQQLEELMNFMDEYGTADTLKIIGMDLNSPPFGLQQTSMDGAIITISSTRTTDLLNRGFKTSCPVDGKEMPSPTGMNYLFAEPIRLDYVWAKIDDAGYQVRVVENTEIPKFLAPNELKYLGIDVKPVATEKKAKPWASKKKAELDQELPFLSDHRPLFVEIYWRQIK